VDQSLPIFLFNAGGMVVDNAVYHLSIYPFIPEIYVLKVENCPKSHQILDVCCYAKF